MNGTTCVLIILALLGGLCMCILLEEGLRYAKRRAYTQEAMKRIKQRKRFDAIANQRRQDAAHLKQNQSEEEL